MPECATYDAYKLLHDGSIVFAQMEANGMRVDMGYLDKTIDDVTSKIRDLEAELRADEVYGTWRKRFGERLKLGSKEQLATVLFDVMGYQAPDERTDTGRHKSDAEAFASVDLPFIKKYNTWTKLGKVKSTYLLGVKREVVDGYLHPFYHLAAGDNEKGGARSYRSSSSDPNAHNFPGRDEEMGAYVRNAFIPRKGCRIVESDFKGIEVGISCCYHHDPVLIDYVKHSPPKDMHRDLTMKIYCIEDPAQVSKTARSCGKGAFVFAQFYGDYYIHCAKNLWKYIDGFGLTLSDGTPIKRVLRKNGIRELGECDPEKQAGPGTFERHLKKVEDWFWNDLLKVYKKWKDKAWDQYQEDGGFTYLTGFRVNGVYRRNQVINYRIQGTAFHCLLWSLIELQRDYQARNGTKLICQIHDSIIADVPDDEVQDYLNLIKEITTVRLPKFWKWICVPMDIEAEVTPLAGEGTWHDKRQWVLNDSSIWVPK